MEKSNEYLDVQELLKQQTLLNNIESWFDIIKKCQNGGVGEIHLELLRLPYDGLECSYGITLNMPRHKLFVNLTSDQQKKFLFNMLKTCVKRLQIPLLRYIYTYEMCKDGVLHLHGLIYKLKEFSGKIEVKIADFIALDFTKHVINIVKNKFNRTINFRYLKEYVRCVSPVCVTQYMNDYKELHRWLMYMYKEVKDI